jgi:hypothetical protein
LIISTPLESTREIFKAISCSISVKLTRHIIDYGIALFYNAESVPYFLHSIQELSDVFSFYLKKKLKFYEAVEYKTKSTKIYQIYFYQIAVKFKINVYYLLFPCNSTRILALIFNVVYNILLNIPDRLADVQATKNGK